MPYLYGPRVVLREYRKSDIPAIRAWVNDAQVTRYLSDIFLAAAPVESTEQFVAHCIQGDAGALRFIVADRETDKYLGQVDLFQINRKEACATLGVVLGGQGARDRGYGTEAICVLLRYAFEQQNLHRVQLEVHCENLRAIRCYEKCGFVREGCRRKAHFQDGEYKDMLEMAVLREEWAMPAFLMGET